MKNYINDFYLLWNTIEKLIREYKEPVTKIRAIKWLERNGFAEESKRILQYTNFCPCCALAEECSRYIKKRDYCQFCFIWDDKEPCFSDGQLYDYWSLSFSWEEAAFYAHEISKMKPRPEIIKLIKEIEDSSLKA